VAVEPSPIATQLDLVSHVAAGTVSIQVPPLPAAPTNVTETRTGDSFDVGWTPDPVTATAITSSTVTATSTDLALPVLTATVLGHAASAILPGVEPLTTYSIVVTESDATGTSPASDPLLVDTPASTVRPSVPTGIHAAWATTSGDGTGEMIVYWTASLPGDSPVDTYQVKIAAHDADPPTPSPQTNSVGGTATEDVFTAQFVDDWSIQVRAHNAAGWSSWSTAIVLGGL
jgi:hypothetical protein